MSSDNKKSRGAIRIILSVAVVLLAAGVLYYAASQRGLLPGSQEEEQAAQEPVVVEQEAKEFSEYSWQEVANISRLIEQAGDEESGREVARQYGILDEDGNLTEQTIRIDLTNGYSIDARVAGVLHDDKADGSGKAGITLMTVGALARGPMNEEATAEGGWRDSYARSWLQNEGMELLPEELRDLIVPVTKYTNNVGDTNSAEEVSATEDTLWLFSPKEVCGEITWESDTYGNDGWGIDQSLNKEGSQYQVFAEHGVSSTSGGDGILKLDDSTGKSTWWYRTPQGANWAHSGANDLFYQVMNTGVPKGYGNPDEDSAYVVGFCV